METVSRVEVIGTRHFRTIALATQFAGKQWSTAVGFRPILFDPSAADGLSA